MPKKNKHNAVEVVTFIFGLLVLAGVVGYLIFQTLGPSESDPNLQVSLKPVEGSSEQFRVIVENIGEKTAVEAQITLEKRGAQKTTSTLVLDFVPGQSREEAIISFPGEAPAIDSIQVSSINFSLP